MAPRPVESDDLGDEPQQADATVSEPTAPAPQPAPYLFKLLDAMSPNGKWEPQSEQPRRAPAPLADRSRDHDDAEKWKRATAYIQDLAERAPGIQGQGGSSATLWAARCACWGFDLGESEGFELLDSIFNPRCVPEWSEAELRRKCRDAMDGTKFDKPRGWLLDAEPERRESSRADYSGVLSHTTTVAPTPRQAGQGGGDSAPIPAAPSPSPPGRPNPPTAPAGITIIRNYHETTNTETKAVTRHSYTPQVIWRDIKRATGGWPKAMNGRLFVPGADHAARWFEEPTDFFAWLAGHLGQSGGVIEWGRGEGQIPKAEFFSYLCHAVDQYEDVQSFPHYPPRPGTCYLHPDIPPGGSGKFDELLRMFSPATDADKHLLKAYFLTTVWGGKPGGRPLHVFEVLAADGRPGQGGGKSTVVQTAGQLVGGYMTFDLSQENAKDLMPRLLSAEGMRIRVLVFDNIKGTRLSSVAIESAITSPRLSGRKLFKGEGWRVNVLSWGLTSNQPSLSKDIAQRSVVTRLKPPDYDAAWDKKLARLVNDHRWEIIGDMIAMLKATPLAQTGAPQWSRWAEWETEVLSRVCDRSETTATVAQRREELDDDAATDSEVRTAVEKYLTDTSKFYIDDIRSKRFRVSSEHLVEAVQKVYKATHNDREGNVISVGRWINTLGLSWLKGDRSHGVRFWRYIGEDSKETDEKEWARKERYPKPDADQ